MSSGLIFFIGAMFRAAPPPQGSHAIFLLKKLDTAQHDMLGIFLGRGRFADWMVNLLNLQQFEGMAKQKNFSAPAITCVNKELREKLGRYGGCDLSREGLSRREFALKEVDNPPAAARGEWV